MIFIFQCGNFEAWNLSLKYLVPLWNIFEGSLELIRDWEVQLSSGSAWLYEQSASHCIKLMGKLLAIALFHLQTPQLSQRISAVTHDCILCSTNTRLLCFQGSRQDILNATQVSTFWSTPKYHCPLMDASCQGDVIVVLILRDLSRQISFFPSWSWISETRIKRTV